MNYSNSTQVLNVISCDFVIWPDDNKRISKWIDVILQFDNCMFVLHDPRGNMLCWLVVPQHVMNQCFASIMLPWFTWCCGVVLCIEMHSSRRPAPKIVADRATIPFPEALLTIFVVVLGIWDARRGWFGKRSYKLRSLKLFRRIQDFLLFLVGLVHGEILEDRPDAGEALVKFVVGIGGGGVFFVFWGMLDEAERQMWIQHAIKQNQQVRSYPFLAKAYIFHEMTLRGYQHINVNDVSSVDLPKVFTKRHRKGHDFGEFTRACLKYIEEDQDNFKRDEVQKIFYLLHHSKKYLGCFTWGRHLICG